MTANKNSLAHQHTPVAIKQRLLSSPKPQYISDAVLGGIDGCVTTFAIISGTIGAGFESSVAVILGVANLLADGFSMAISNYESIKAHAEQVAGLRSQEEQHIDQVPQGEQEEVRQIFAQKGFQGETLATIVSTITSNDRLWVDTMLAEEHGLRLINPSPIRSGITTFAAFVLVGVVPLLPFLNQSTALEQRFLYSACLAAVMFFAIGALKSLSFNRPYLKSGLTTLTTGSIASGLAFLAGYGLQRCFGA